jgi:uncharacterized protein (TIGR00251 family)
MPNPSDYGIAATPGGIRLRVYVTPRSSSNAIVGAHNGELKIALAAPPVEGAANRALVEYLAKRLAVPRSAVRLLSGDTSRHKVLGVDGVSAETAMLKLGLE